MTSPVLALEAVSKRYDPGAPNVLEDVAFALNDGEFLAVVGPSGCGKTTLLRSIACLLGPDTGRILHRGEEVGRPPAWVSAVFQDYSRSLFPWLTVQRNVAFGLHALDRRTRKARVAESLEAVGLEDSGALYPWQLSGGMQQRCALARAIAASPKLLLLDEPFASVDAQTRIDLEDMVMRICREFRLSTLLVTHDIDEAVFMADRVLVLSSRPASVVEDIDVDLGRPRDQLKTKESQRFLELRHHVFGLIRPGQGRRNQVASADGAHEM